MKAKIINSYVKESVYNKGSFIMIVECEDGSSYVVGGQHHHPTYLQSTETSNDFKLQDKTDGK